MPTSRDPMELTVHSLPDPASAQQQQRRKGRMAMLMVVAICAAPVLASYFSFYVLKLSGKANGDLIVPTVDIPPALSLTDLSGKAVKAESLKGQWLLTVVQDGACDAACEKILFAQRQLREMFGKDRDKIDKLWLIPDDTPLRPELQQAMTTGVPVTVLRVPKDQLEAWLKPAAGHQLRQHYFVVDPMGRWMLRSQPINDPQDVQDIKQDMDKLLKANAGWDRPGR